MCTNSYYKNKTSGLNVTFHTFPKLASRRKEWLIRIRRDEGRLFKVSNYESGHLFTITQNRRGSCMIILLYFHLFQVTDRTVVCCEHFEESCFFQQPARCGRRRRVLLPTAIPTKFSWSTVVNSRRKLIRKASIEQKNIPFDSEETMSIPSDIDVDAENRYLLF